MAVRIAAATPPYSQDVQSHLERLTPPGKPPLALFTTLARDARLFGKLMGGGLLDRGHLTLRQREIVIGRTTALCGAEYEWGVHVALFGPRVGLSIAQQSALVHGNADDPCWPDDVERLLLKLCDRLHATCDVDDGLWEELEAHFDAPALLELLMLAGFYRMVSYLTNALRLPRESYAPAFPAAPANPAPRA